MSEAKATRDAVSLFQKIGLARDVQNVVLVQTFSRCGRIVLKDDSMLPQVLVASASAYRCWWYAEQLRLYNMDVTTSADGIECVRQMRALQPDVVVIEPTLLWGGCQGILAIRSEEPEFQQIPVVIVAVDGVSPEWYQLSRYSVQGLLTRRPSGQKLAATLLAVINEAESKPLQEISGIFAESS